MAWKKPSHSSHSNIIVDYRKETITNQSRELLRWHCTPQCIEFMTLLSISGPQRALCFPQASQFSCFGNVHRPFEETFLGVSCLCIAVVSFWIKSRTSCVGLALTISVTDSCVWRSAADPLHLRACHAQNLLKHKLDSCEGIFQVTHTTCQGFVGALGASSARRISYVVSPWP